MNNSKRLGAALLLLTLVGLQVAIARSEPAPTTAPVMTGRGQDSGLRIKLFLEATEIEAGRGLSVVVGVSNENAYAEPFYVFKNPVTIETPEGFHVEPSPDGTVARIDTMASTGSGVMQNIEDVAGGTAQLVVAIDGEFVPIRNWTQGVAWSVKVTPDHEWLGSQSIPGTVTALALDRQLTAWARLIDGRGRVVATSPKHVINVTRSKE